MGFVRKITGVQAQIDATKENAAAQEAATKQAAADQQAALMQTAKAAANQQALLASRSQAEAAASAAASTPLETADVQLAVDANQTTAAARRSRRAQFGYSGSTGVSI